MPPRAAGAARTRSRLDAGPTRLARALAFARGLPDLPLLDRLVRGRAWIPLLGVMLAGIVAMQVELLKLGASIGRSIDRGTVLQSQNQSLRATVAGLADDQRIERLAARMGMVMPAPPSVGFLTSHPAGEVQRALVRMRAPDPSLQPSPSGNASSSTSNVSSSTSNVSSSSSNASSGG